LADASKVAVALGDGSHESVMSKKLASPNDSLQQSTREPSTRSGDRSSLDTSSFNASNKKFLTGGAQIGGGSFKSYIVDHLARMHSDIESTTRKLELEQRRLHTLDKNLAIAESEWAAKREKYKLFQSKQDDALNQKSAEYKLLERKLVKATADQNEGSCKNEALREEIDQLRQERLILNSVFKQLEKDIGLNRRQVEKVKHDIDESKASREEAKQKAVALNRMLERERREFKARTKEMQKELHNENEVQKEQENLQRTTRAQDQTSGSAGGPRCRTKRTYMVADEEEAFSESLMHRRILKLSFLNTIQRRHIRQHQKNIEVFEQAFATIKSSTGISDIEEIVKIFIALEQRNFSLLTYVNQLNREIESIDIRNRELKSQLTNYQQADVQASERKNAALSELSVQIMKTRSATEDKEKLTEEAAAALTECRPLIWNIVKFLKEEMPTLVSVGHEGDPPPMKVPVPDEHEENMNIYLMYIEEALLQFRICLSQEAQSGSQYRPHPKAINRATRPNELPQAHITGDDSDDDPETGLGDRPWTRSELRERAQAMIQRRKRKQHGKLVGEEKRTDNMDDNTDTKLTMAPPPAREYAPSSSIASQGSKEDKDVSLSKSPSVSGKQTENFNFGDTPLREEDEVGGGGDRKDMWWRGQGKEKRK